MYFSDFLVCLEEYPTNRKVFLFHAEESKDKKGKYKINTVLFKKKKKKVVFLQENL